MKTFWLSLFSFWWTKKYLLVIVSVDWLSFNELSMHGCSSYLPDFYWFYPQINSSQLVYKYKRGPRKMDTSHIIGKSKISNFGSPVGCLAGRQLSVTCWNNLTYFIFRNHVNIYCLHFLCSFSFLYCCLFQWKSSTRRKMLHLDFSRNLETFLSCIIFLGF